MLTQRQADSLRDHVQPAVPGLEVSSVPWSDRPKSPWIITVWDTDGVPLFDVFEADGRYVLRKIGRGAVIAETGFDDLHAAVRAAAVAP